MWRRPHTATNGNKNVDAIGKVTRTGLETLFDQALDTDAAAIRLESPWLVPRKIYQDEGMPLIEVRSVWSPTLGTNVCFSGRRSEERRCGPIISLPEETNALAGNQAAWTLEMCFQQGIWAGDSGSPVWVEGTGVAVHFFFDFGFEFRSKFRFIGKTEEEEAKQQAQEDKKNSKNLLRARHS